MRAAHVALVNEAFVKKFLDNRDPIGQHVRSPMLKFEQQDFVFAEGNDMWFEIIGVAADARNNAGFRNGEENIKEKPVEPAFYVPHTLSDDAVHELPDPNQGRRRHSHSFCGAEGAVDRSRNSCSQPAPLDLVSWKP